MAEEAVSAQSGCEAGQASACCEAEEPWKMERGNAGCKKQAVRTRALESREGDGGPPPPATF